MASGTAGALIACAFAEAVKPSEHPSTMAANRPHTRAVFATCFVASLVILFSVVLCRVLRLRQTAHGEAVATPHRSQLRLSIRRTTTCRLIVLSRQHEIWKEIPFRMRRSFCHGAYKSTIRFFPDALSPTRAYFFATRQRFESNFPGRVGASTWDQALATTDS